MSRNEHVLTQQKLSCYHCGNDCKAEMIRSNGKEFCCQGCRLVYDLLKESNLCTYYDLNQSPGTTAGQEASQYTYLDRQEVSEALIHFRNEGQAHITFYLPKIHCSSCIWLLENLHKLDKGIIHSSVNFIRKEITVIYQEQRTKLSAVAGLLSRLGYEPLISLNDTEGQKKHRPSYRGILKIGIAGFCFGNIMMLSFPEYFSSGNFFDQSGLKPFFGYINILLSLPVFFYAASDFFISAWKSIRERYLNIDAAIALAINVTFGRSLYEILSGTGAGYMDSMSGIVFFMLLGRYFQERTYGTLSFERDYKSYFPVAVSVLREGVEECVPAGQLKKGMRILIRNRELIPADAILLSDHTHIDYSFVTGESVPVRKNKGALLYAGGRQLEGAVELQTVKEVSQSYLTRLWNAGVSAESEQKNGFVDKLNRHFTLSVMCIATLSFAFWAFSDMHHAMNAFTAVLIVACPCGLLLTSTFCYANMLRIFGRQKLYLKNASVIEKLSGIDAIVFDKTGTLTHGEQVEFKGSFPEAQIPELAASLCAQSMHPLSKKIYEHYRKNNTYAVKAFEEIPGEGISGYVNGKYLMMGSDHFVCGQAAPKDHHASSRVYLSVDGILLGFFSISSRVRKSLNSVVRNLSHHYELHLLSGDHDGERSLMSEMFHKHQMHFNQGPDDKLNFIKELQQRGKQVMMIGDGLNDAAALRQSDAGIAVSDHTNNFTPACDAIMDGSSFHRLKAFLDYSRMGKRIIAITFGISILYNIIGLSFAVKGNLSPMIAAILMPCSSVSIVLLSTLAGSILGKRIFRAYRSAKKTDQDQFTS